MTVTNLSRRRFIRTAGVAFTTIVPSITLLAQDKKKPDPLAPDLVKDFVIKGHNDLEGVKKLLEETPGILNATWDWGGGDFETALGGAGHMGRVDIAEYLINKGARIDIFVASMLGKLDVVKNIAEAYPEVLKSKGPHGLSLVFHAEKGGEKAMAVLDYFKGKGLVK